MQLPLVNYEAAKMLKEAGFDCETHDFFYDEDKGGWGKTGTEGYGFNIDYYTHNWNGSETLPFKPFCRAVSRPTVAQSLMWLREAKGVHVEIRITGMGKYWGEAKSINTSATTESFPTHSEAEHAALIKALETLKSK